MESNHYTQALIVLNASDYSKMKPISKSLKYCGSSTKDLKMAKRVSKITTIDNW